MQIMLNWLKINAGMGIQFYQMLKSLYGGLQFLSDRVMMFINKTALVQWRLLVERYQNTTPWITTENIQNLI